MVLLKINSDIFPALFLIGIAFFVLFLLIGLGVRFVGRDYESLESDIKKDRFAKRINQIPHQKNRYQCNKPNQKLKLF